MKIADVAVIGAVILLAVAVFILLPLGDEPQYVVVKHNGAVIDRLALGTDIQKTYELPNGYNTVKIKDKRVSVIAADCGGDCIKSGEQSLAGSSIVCLPHNFTVTITGDGLDAVTR